MTNKNYQKPELEMITLYTEGVLADSIASAFTGENLDFITNDGIKW